jgi:DNA-directed RNA polymerase specialized sigma24 family protein
MSATPQDVTTLLQLASQRDRVAQDQLFRTLEGELRKQAKALIRRERPSPNLQTTVLVDEAFVKLIGNQNLSWQDRSQFYRYAARVMRQILVDEARKRRVEKRGGGENPLPLGRVPEPIASWRQIPMTGSFSIAAREPRRVPVSSLKPWQTIRGSSICSPTRGGPGTIGPWRIASYGTGRRLGSTSRKRRNSVPMTWEYGSTTP